MIFCGISGRADDEKGGFVLARNMEEWNRMTSTICILATIGVYLIGMLFVGCRYARNNESSQDF